MTDKDVRVRFAPSPTGYMHIGNLRTALYNWLHARHTGGTFILRIEDTDRTRHNEDAIEVITKGLKRLGLDYDEGPTYQSQRLDIYSRYADMLIEKGVAYKSDHGDADKGEAVVLQRPMEEISWVDLLRGRITFAPEDLKELVIIKSDGYPTYNFACAVDDHEMNITQVLRGDDHISNSPKQLMVYDALGWEPPEFGHFPMILGPDGTRLSKRHGAVKVTDFLDAGYFPHTVINYIALLGWSPGDDREIMTMDEMVKLFTLKRVRSTAAMFDYEKFSWMNGEYVRRTPIKELHEPCLKAVQEKGLGDGIRSDEWFDKVIELYQERFRTFPEFADKTYYFFVDDERVLFLPKAVKKVLKKDGADEALKLSADALEQLDTFDEENIEKALRGVAERMEKGFGKVAQPVRVAVTGTNQSAELFATLIVLGQERAVNRIRRALELRERDAFPMVEEQSDG